MTLMQRIGRVLSALMSGLCAWIIVEMGEDGFQLVSLILSISLIVMGVRSLWFYFSMARHMVDGRNVLWFGVVVLDFGILSVSITRYQGEIVTFYLLAIYAFTGLIGIMRALEARSAEAPSWRMNLVTGIVRIAFAGAAVFFGLLRGDMRDLCLIYAGGIVYSAVVRFASAFRKTAIVYIQ